MRIGLGIDTGGTYTDAVLYQFDSKKILDKAKSLTTKDDLKTGIMNALDGIDDSLFPKIELVSLSTTLATNACVEDKGLKAKLILVGLEPKILEQVGDLYGLPAKEDILFLKGGHTISGDLKAEVEYEMLDKFIEDTKDTCDSYAVVELWGMRNNSIEKAVKERIRSRTNNIIVCGYEITNELNALKRAASAVLNAQLIPIINEFLDAIKVSLEKRNIDAPLVIVRGDTSLMSEAFAREKPIETLLCGPAASVHGGMSLAKEENCIIVDMGGTTTDMAMIKNYQALLANKGAKVGKWKTGTHSVHIHTVGLGGDSYIRHERNHILKIGNNKVTPLSVLCTQYPNVLDDIKNINAAKRKHSIPLCEFFYLSQAAHAKKLLYTPNEKRAIEVLKNGPMSIEDFALATSTTVYHLGIERLENRGIIVRSALTPTDIMHIERTFEMFNRDGAYYGAEICAFQLGISLNEFIEKVNNHMKCSLYKQIVMMLIEKENKNLIVDDVVFDKFLTHAYESDSNEFITPMFKTEDTLVGIGAPVFVYLKDVAKKLNTSCVIPTNYEVANAIGAITGKIHVREEVMIKPIYDSTGINSYKCFYDDMVKTFDEDSYEEALIFAKEQAKLVAIKKGKRRGAKQYTFSIQVNDDSASYANSEGKEKKLLLETLVVANLDGDIFADAK